jgi:signal transduction histidine kinase
MDKAMSNMCNKGFSNGEQTILLVSDDAALCAAARREFESRIAGLRVAAVSNVEAARRVLKEDAPAVIVFELEEESAAADAGGSQVNLPRLDAIVTSLTVHAPVVVIGAAERREGLSELIASGAADFVTREVGSCLPEALDVIQRRLRQTAPFAGKDSEHFAAGKEDFGEVLRHELNNPLTGILGNAELLLAEIRRKDDGKLPHGGQQRVETIASLAVRLRETVRRLSTEWEARQPQRAEPRA